MKVTQMWIKKIGFDVICFLSKGESTFLNKGTEDANQVQEAKFKQFKVAIWPY